ncbi:DUF6804 family protein [Pontibacter kalidii]|uniref:DUF6804 family protein n=1 Tax=Pontibacter kalidii TaxID=2592049 RepID=UPI0022559144|nr:DUF6804 family protein [Pontibacter kalidii]
MDKAIKLVLIILLFLCLLQMPFGFYQFVRFAAFVGFGLLALLQRDGGNKNAAFIYGALALLFQPFFKVVLGRELWIIVDVVVALGLALSLINAFRSKANSPNRN